MKKLLLLTLGISFSLLSFSQLAVYDTLTQIQMVEGLSGPGVNFSNISVDCPGGDNIPQMAQFDGSLSNIGIETGIIMSSGGVDSTLQSNDDFITGWFSSNNGDSDLDDIVTPDNTNDACIIEFDLQMSGDTLRFNYVFASEEYPEFVNDFNDVFGFFISGPGIAGPFSSPAGFPNGSKNIAVLPDGTTPVTINNINNGDNDCFSGGPNGPCTNCEFYVDNCGGSTVEYDGFTTKLTAKILVTPCETYHLKLAIADVLDGSFDSGVFLENGSFASSEVNFGTAFSDVFEGCTEGGVDFLRKDTTKQDSVNIYFGFGGTATNGVDYGVTDEDGNFSPFPDSLLIVPGNNDTTLYITGTGDGMNEEDEEIVIYVFVDDCVDGQLAIDSIVLTLHDFIYIDLFPDTIVCPNEEVNLSFNYDTDTFTISNFNLTVNPGYNTDSLLYYSVFDLENEYYSIDSLMTFRSLNDTLIYAEITDSFNCKGYDTLFLDILEPELINFTFDFLDEPFDTIVDSVLFTNESLLPDSVNYIWNFGDSLGTESTELNPTFVYGDTGVYYVSLTVIQDGIADCPLVKEVVVIKRDIPQIFPNVITPNGDGINDVFRIGRLRDYNLSIYNRWGKKVYENIFYQDDFDAEGLLDGSYYYQIVIPADGTTYKGWFQVIR